MISFCLIMSISICFCFVDNSAHNATRLSLSNKSFLLIKSCVFFSYWAHLCTYKTIAPRIFGVCFPFLPKLCMFSQRIFGKSKFSTKTEIMLVFVQTNKSWKFRWFLREVTIHLENPKKKTKKHHEVTPKLSFIWMNNEKSLCILAWKQGLPILNACIWDEERPSLIILSQGWNISFAVPFWAW